MELKDLQSEIDDKLSVVTSAKDGDSKFANVYLDGTFDSITSKKLKSQYLISLKTSFEDKFNNGWNSYNYNRYLQIYEYNVKNIIYYSEPEMRQNKVYVLVYVNNKLGHEIKVDVCFFRNGNGKSVCGGINVRYPYRRL